MIFKCNLVSHKNDKKIENGESFFRAKRNEEKTALTMHIQLESFFPVSTNNAIFLEC